MSFYDELSKYYDAIFPASEATVRFLNNRVKENARILDIACGTGNHSIALSKLGHHVDGIDLDRKMIDIAKDKAVANGLATNFVSGDMRDVSEIFTQGNYDMAYCIGNSLVHLQTKEEIRRFFEAIHSILGMSGRLIIQIINYDRIFKFNIDHLPEINRQEEGVRFIRKYDYKADENKIYFNTEIIVENEGKSFTNSIPLLPLKSFELVELLKMAGFNDTKLYGDFQGNEHTVESYPTIVVASK